MAGEHVTLRRDGAIATLTLERPEKLNALTPAMLDGIEVALETIVGDAGCRALVVTGAGGRAFCAGADIDAWSVLDPMAMWRDWIPRGHAVFDRLEALSRPAIAAIDGIAFGGGLELALACDLRVASPRARFALPEVTLGTIPGWGGGPRLAALVGAGRAKQMIFTGQPIDAATAERWGLVNEVAREGKAEGGALRRAAALARQIAANAPLAVQASKQVLALAGTKPAAMDEALASSVVAASEDAAEGIAAFKARRAPKFRGR